MSLKNTLKAILPTPHEVKKHTQQVWVFTLIDGSTITGRILDHHHSYLEVELSSGDTILLNSKVVSPIPPFPAPVPCLESELPRANTSASINGLTS